MDKRFAELDAIRGIAAFGVVLFHATMFVTQMRDYGDFPFHFAIGRWGVNLFFVVSGFVIYYTLERCRTLGDFAFSRFSRLYPTYWAALILGALSCFVFDKPLWLTGYAINTTMLQRFVGVGDVDMVFWTLSVELMFYVWMGLVFAAGWLARIVTISLVWLAASAIWSLTREHLPGFVNTFLILEHIPYFIGGMMFMRIQRDGWRREYLVVLAAAVGVATMIAGVTGLAVSSVVFACGGLAVSGALIFLATPVLLWLGAISYALYVTHYQIGWRTLEWLHDVGVPTVVSVPLVIANSLLIASAVTYWVERPAIKWLRERRRPALQSAITT